jgi:undecaprenyl-phosphate galactose phosphotransferase
MEGSYGGYMGRYYGNQIQKIIETVFIFLADLVVLFLIFQLAFFIRKALPLFFHLPFPDNASLAGATSFWWVLPVWIFFFCYEGLYTRRFSFWDEIRVLWKVTFLSTVGIFAIVSLGKISDQISRTVVVLMGMIAFMLLPLSRLILKKILRKFGLLKRRVLILGAGTTGRLVLKALKRERNYGYKVIGFVDDDPEKIGTRILGIKVHKGVDRALNYINRCNVEDLFIAMPGAGKERLQGLINNLQHKVENILFVPDVFGIAVLGTSLQHFFQEEAFAFEMKNNLSRPVNKFVKKVFDILLAILILPFVLVLLLLFAILIKVDSKGPVIFTQDRIGKNGKTFRCFKFRTMRVNADSLLKEFFRKNPYAEEEWVRYWKLKDDPRITRVGRFLRSTSLDELPQIFNVLRGEMSLVGPRPVTQKEIDDYYRETAGVCFCVPPGITGLWQVSGRSDESYDRRIALDSWYVRNWNLWLDIVILLKTVRVVVKREGAY